jgi:hypothetical protein
MKELRRAVAERRPRAPKFNNISAVKALQNPDWNS